MSGDLESSCLVCRTPLAGVLGAIGRSAGIRRSSQNPNLCNRCDVHVEEGRIVEVAVFFAGLTGHTELVREQGPERAHQITDAFLRQAKDAVVGQDGFVVHFAGGRVMALFNVPLRHDDYRRRAVAAAGALHGAMEALGGRLGVRVQASVGIAAGHARVGRLGSDDMKDYTAVGDVVSRASGLVERADPGAVLVDAEVHAHVRDAFPEAAPARALLPGQAEPEEIFGLAGGRMRADVSQPGATRARTARVGMLLAAIFGAPCAGVVLLNPLIVAFGLGATSFSALASVLDQTVIRVPLLSVATAAALANLAAIAWRRWSAAPRDAVAARWAPAARSDWRAIAVSFGALGTVAFELIAHAVMH